MPCEKNGINVQRQLPNSKRKDVSAGPAAKEYRRSPRNGPRRLWENLEKGKTFFVNAVGFVMPKKMFLSQQLARADRETFSGLHDSDGVKYWVYL